MYKFFFTINFLAFGINLIYAKSEDKPNDDISKRVATRNKNEVVFQSSDKELERTFTWAKSMALSYAHDGKDAVGYWYEAALPGRKAFCMRDVSHQSIGGEMLGLSRHNFNMMAKFAENISVSRDWCSYWEIDSQNRPCVADYSDDDNFWYNLNANFDVLFACWRLYEWTGDERYLNNEVLKHFYDISVDEFIEKWMLQPENMMSRPKHMNNRIATKGRYKEVRGLPSYVENYPGLTNSSDLIASMYGGLVAYSNIMKKLGKQGASEAGMAKANAYYDLLKNTWWDDDINAYHTFWTHENKFANGEGLTYMLWFNASHEPDRIKGTIEKIMTRKDWNIENISHFPLLWYRYNYVQEAYNILTDIVEMKRSEYPEVSYGMIEGIVSGTMGIAPSASTQSVTTLPKIARECDYVEVRDLPMLRGYITVRHDGNKASKFLNNTPNEIVWKAAFMGDIREVEVNGKRRKAKIETDIMGNKVSYVEIRIPAGKEAQAKIV